MEEEADERAVEGQLALAAELQIDRRSQHRKRSRGRGMGGALRPAQMSKDAAHELQRLVGDDGGGRLCLELERNLQQRF